MNKNNNISFLKKNEKPLITVVTVVFNAALTLEDTIRSVISQSYDNYEFIVIDGGSTDGTLEIIKKYEDFIDCWITEKDNGIYDAMNKGIALAKGDYIGMLNADDYFASELVLEKIASNLVESGVDAVFSYLDVVDYKKSSKIIRKYRVSSYSKWLLRIGLMPAHPTFYCKKSLYSEAGLYRTDFRIAADFEMLVRLLFKYRIRSSLINEVTVKMRSGGLSSSGLKSSWILNREIIRACKENHVYTNFFLVAIKIPYRLLEKVF